jgi:rSAM/selenodomain-associated transferase 1
MAVDDAEHSLAADELLIIQFARSPQPGRVKTRMMPTLTANQACQLHEDLLLWTCRQLCTSGIGPVELWLSGDAQHPIVRQCRDYGVSAVRQQNGDDLGQRMQGALVDGLSRYRQVILVGSDCPGIDAGYLQRAYRELTRHSVVLGPADDGGYVLIGAREDCPGVFKGISWGQDSVYAQTVSALDQQNLSWTALGSLPDIDRPEDLVIWQALVQSAAVS